MEQQTNNNFSDILSAFGAINSSLAFDVYLPIAKKTIRFKQLTTGQEKRIAKQLLVGDDKTIYSIMPEILQENCLDPSFIVKKSSIIDFFCIILCTRIYSIGNMINVRTVKKTNIDQSTQDSIKTGHKNIPSAEINKENTEQKKTKVPERIDIKIDLIKICEAISENTKDFKEIVVSDDDLPYQIICGVPSVETIQRSLSTDDIENEDIITKLLKFVTEIKLINQKTGEAKSIVFNDFSIDEAKQLVEQIPNKLLVKATTKIVDIFNLLTTIQLYKFKLGNVEYYQALNFMNLDFFTSF